VFEGRPVFGAAHHGAGAGWGEPVADQQPAGALMALAAPILVAEFLVAVIASTGGPQWLWWVVAGLLVALVAVLLLSAWLTLPLVPPEEQL
jgi:hypothetical protein